MVVCFQGNNARAIKTLDSESHGYVTFQKALQCAKDKDLHPSFRSKYVELIKGQAGHAIRTLYVAPFCESPQLALC